MSNTEESNESLTGKSNKGFNKSQYQKDYMARKRAEERLRKESGEDRVGEVSLASVEKEAVVQTDVPRIEMASQDEPPGLEQQVLTTTDRKFEELSPGYWIYGKEEISRKCWECGKVFTTRLELNKFCGPKCKEKWLSDAFGKLRAK